MNLLLKNYAVDQELYSSPSSIIFRGRRKTDNFPVIIKRLRKEYPNQEEISGLRREYETLKYLAIPEVPQAIALEQTAGDIALILKDSAGESVDSVIRENSRQTAHFLRIAILIARAVQAIHQKKIIHRDLKPQHMLFCPNGAIEIIDFGISTELSQGPIQPVDIDSFDGTLSYISPEQTGRMNRVVDERSDLYSLGVSFFELITGQLPFPEGEPLELVHAHIARTPPRVDSIRPDVPQVVASIIEKLMAKVAEDRYQTAAGLVADLERCSREIEEFGAIASFSPGSRDLSAALQIPQKLFGREEPLRNLQSVFAEVCQGKTKLVLINGPSGIGKTSLVRCLSGEIATRGHYVTGKFEQLHGNTPYFALVTACRDLVRSALRESSESLKRRKKALLEALGSNVGLISIIVPELTMIVGEQQLLPMTGVLESRNRFAQAFESFLGVFVTPDEPLVIFLDDLHWADPESLRLLRRIVTSPELQPLLVIGAYRDDETAGIQSLHQEIEEIEKRVDEPVQIMRLESLGHEHMARLLSETLSRTTEDVEPLAAVLLEKTGGNPFHLIQFLKDAYDDGLLRPDFTIQGWVWDLNALRERRVADNVVDLIVERLQGLPEEARQVLMIGACSGYEFDFNTILLTSDLPSAALEEGFRVALKEGILRSLDRSFKYTDVVGENGKSDTNVRFHFVHDRVQQAAYQLIDEAQRKAVHLKIGRHLRRELGDNLDDDMIFKTVSQMNHGIELLEDAEERLWLAELNLICARKAQSTVAIAVAHEHAKYTLVLTGDEGWQTHYHIVCPAHILMAECEYLSGNLEQALSTLDEIDARATEIMDRVVAGNLRVPMLTSMGHVKEACRTSVKTLRLLGLEVPEPEDAQALNQAVELEFAAVQDLISGFDTKTLANLPEMTELVHLTQFDTLRGIIPAAFMLDKTLMLFMVLKGVRLSIEHGISDLTSFFFVQYAFALMLMTGDLAAANRFGKLGIEIGEKRKNLSAMGPANFVYGTFIAHWCEPISVSLEHLRLGQKRSLEFGDLPHAAYCTVTELLYQLSAGYPLMDIRASLPDAFARIVRMDDEMNRAHLAVCERYIAALTGEPKRIGTLNGDGFDEAQFAQDWPEGHIKWLNVFRCILLFHTGDYPNVIVSAELGTQIAGSMWVTDCHFFAGLAHAALARHHTGNEQKKHMDCLAEIVEIFRNWAISGPANHSHQYLLLVAEQTGNRGDFSAAAEQYEGAAENARAQGFIQHQALAWELCGNFHLRAHRPKLAGRYLADAVHAYQAWGAVAKVRQLCEKHPEFLLETDGQSSLPGLTSHSTHRSTGSHQTSRTANRMVGLDLESAMAATQAIAGELESDKLLNRLLRIVIENAGAQRCVLVSQRNEDLYIEADYTVVPENMMLHVNIPLTETYKIPVQVVRYVARTHETIVSGSASVDRIIADDIYIREYKPKSILCLALRHQGQLSAVLYLESNAASHVFNPGRISRIQFLTAYAASALENSRLYEEVRAARQKLEERVQRRTVELSQRNRELRGVFDAVSQGLMTIDRNGNVTGGVSAKVTDWFGSFEEHSSWFNILSGIDQRFTADFRVFFDQTVHQADTMMEEFARMSRTLSLEGRTLSFELRPIGKTSDWQWLLVVISDVTDAERQKQLEIELRHSQKLESVGRLAAGIAHEINTPTQFVNDNFAFLKESFSDVMALLATYRELLCVCADAPGAPESILEKINAAEEDADIDFIEENIQAAFSEAQDGLTRIATIVGAMKEFAHPEQREKLPSDINRALKNTLSIARNEYKYVADVETSFEELPLVFCHLSDLNQVFLNLIVNAAHAVGEIVEKTKEKGFIRVRTAHEEDFVCISIEDTGGGIPDNIKDRIFDPFFTTKEVGRGTGQGLMIARNIVVKKHGGTLDFESTKGQGTTFTIRLPIEGKTEEEAG